MLPLLVMVCLTMIGSGMMVPVLSLYAATFSVSAALVGMLVTIFGVGRIISNFPGGWLSQRLGRRPLLAAGPIVIAIGSVGAALTGDFLHLLAWRFVQGLGSGIYMTVSLAALADMSTAQTRARLVGYYQAALQAGASIGPLIGGYVAEGFGLAAPFWVLAVISALTGIFAVAIFRDVPPRVSRSMSGALGARRGLLNSQFLSISLVNGVVFFTRTACLFQLFPLMGHQVFKLSVGMIGVAVTLAGVAVLFVLPLAGWVTDRIGARLAVIASCVATGVGLALIVVGDHPFWFWSSMVVYGLAGGFNSPAIGAYTIESLPRHRYGEGMGLQRTISDIGYVAGPVVAGVASDMSGFGLGGGIVANLVLLGAATALFVVVSGGARARSEAA